MEMKTRQPAVAGAFYPAESHELREMIRHFLRNVPAFDSAQRPRVLIVPHAGYIYSGQVAAHAFARLGRSGGRQENIIKKIILLGPAHFVYVTGAVSDPHSHWQTPLGQTPIVKQSIFKISEAAHRQEHSLEVELPFLQTVLEECAILPLVVGEVDPHELSGQIETLIDDETLLIVSSDLSHYYDYETAVSLDRATILAIEALEPAGVIEACGRIPIQTALHLALKKSWRPQVLNYKNSGDTGGDKSRVVGYLSAVFYDK